MGASILALAVCEFMLAVPIYYFVKKNGHTFYSRPHLKGLFEEDPKIGFVQTPNLNIKRPKVNTVPNAPRVITWYDVQTDKNGFRYKRDLPLPKPEGEIRIFSLGGSTTLGGESSNEGTYPQQLENKIHDPKTKVINAGSGGYRSIHLFLLYKYKIRNLDPDIITIYSGWNDYEESMFSYWEPDNPFVHSLSSQMRLAKIPLGDFALVWGAGKLYNRLKDYDRTVETGSNETAGKKYIRVADETGWQEEYRKNIQNLISLAKSENVVPVIIVFPAPEFEGAPQEVKDFANLDLNMAGRWDGVIKFLSNIRKIQRDLAQSNNVPLIDVNAEFEKFNGDYKNKFKFFTDKMHLTPKGNKLIAEAMLQPIRNIIKENSDR